MWVGVCCSQVGICRPSGTNRGNCWGLFTLWLKARLLKLKKPKDWVLAPLCGLQPGGLVCSQLGKLPSDSYPWVLLPLCSHSADTQQHWHNAGAKWKLKYSIPLHWHYQSHGQIHWHSSGSMQPAWVPFSSEVVLLAPTQNCLQVLRECDSGPEIPAQAGVLKRFARHFWDSYFSLTSGSTLKKQLAPSWEFAGNLDSQHWMLSQGHWGLCQQKHALKRDCLSMLYRYSTTYWIALKPPIAVVFHHQEQFSWAHFAMNHLWRIWMHVENFVM